MGMTIEVTSGAIATLLEEAAKSAPWECCGLLLGAGGRVHEVRPAANVAQDPARCGGRRTRRRGQPRNGARAGGPNLLGYYHSHPAGHPVPSATDCDHASGDLRIWAIVAAGEVGFWRDTPGGFEALCYAVVAE
jgi:proteasome lid subunit RPN8/RPN11